MSERGGAFRPSHPIRSRRHSVNKKYALGIQIGASEKATQPSDVYRSLPAAPFGVWRARAAESSRRLFCRSHQCPSCAAAEG